ncbi:MAG: helix-turn-helix domain-containing protein [Deinococcota bacterium]|nr:helix-turn-helix domain-containing protein [Deinococcota bacterium]
MKEVSSSRELLVVNNPQAAATLLDPDLSMLLKPFMQGACTVGEAAGNLNVKPADLFYRVQRMVALGLLEVVREEPRRGRPLKYYRSSASAFFIPFWATSATSVEDFVVNHDEGWSRRLARSLAHAYTHEASLEHWGLHISYREDGFLMFDLASHPPQQNGAAVRGAFSNWDSSF